MDGWDFKHYVLGTLFYRYISEKLTDYLNEEAREAYAAGDESAKNFDYAALSDDKAMVEKDGIVDEQGISSYQVNFLSMCGRMHLQTRI